MANMTLIGVGMNCAVHYRAWLGAGQTVEMSCVDSGGFFPFLFFAWPILLLQRHWKCWTSLSSLPDSKEGYEKATISCLEDLPWDRGAELGNGNYFVILHGTRLSWPWMPLAFNASFTN